MGFKMVLLPPNTQPDWPEKIRAVVPDCEVLLFDSPEAARQAIVDADAAYGDVVPDLLNRARRLRWIQAPAAAPPATASAAGASSSRARHSATKEAKPATAAGWCA